MRRKAIIILFVILLLLAAVAGGLFLARPTIIDRQRQASEAELLSLIESGQLQIKIPDIPPMEGEEEEFSELEYDVPVQDAEPVEITGYGVISIPAIDLKMPVVNGADSYSIRAAAGWYPESAEMGGAGNCVIFGHRMSGYGRHFNRLDELKEGDHITLYNADGESFTYTVTGSEVIKPDILMDTLLEHNEGFSLTLVTCTPTGVGSHRLLVYAAMDTSVG